MGEFNLKNRIMTDCGSVVYASCEDKTVNMSVAGFKALANEVVDTGTFMIKIGFATAGQSMSGNMVRGMNAIRCAFVSGFFNVWMLLASAYYAALEFGFASDLEKAMNDMFPYLCTCTAETNDWATKLGASLDMAAKFDSCTDETGGVN